MVRKSSGGRQPAWTKDQIKQGLDLFYAEHARWPTVDDITSYQFLPSARSIQRSFGGWINFRKEFGIEAVFHAGENRQKIAVEISRRSQEWTENLHLQLIDFFGESAIHREAQIPGTRERLDFLIYIREREGEPVGTSNLTKFGIDHFFPANISNLKKIINIKQKKYLHYCPIYFVNLNSEIPREEIEACLLMKENTFFSKRRLF